MTIKCYAVKGDAHRNLGALTFRNHELIDPTESFASSVSNVSNAKNVHRRWCGLSEGGEVQVQWMVNSFRGSPGPDYAMDSGSLAPTRAKTPQAKLNRLLKNQPKFDPDPVRVAASTPLTKPKFQPSTSKVSQKIHIGERTTQKAKRKDITPGNSPPTKIMKQPERSSQPDFEKDNAKMPYEPIPTPEKRSGRTTQRSGRTLSPRSPVDRTYSANQRRKLAQDKATPLVAREPSNKARKALAGAQAMRKDSPRLSPRSGKKPGHKQFTNWPSPLSQPASRSASPRLNSRNQPEPEGSRSTWWSRSRSPSPPSRLASPPMGPATFDVKPKNGALSFTNSTPNVPVTPYTYGQNSPALFAPPPANDVEVQQASGTKEGDPTWPRPPIIFRPIFPSSGGTRPYSPPPLRKPKARSTSPPRSPVADYIHSPVLRSDSAGPNVSSPDNRPAWRSAGVRGRQDLSHMDKNALSVAATGSLKVLRQVQPVVHEVVKTSNCGVEVIRSRSNSPVRSNPSICSSFINEFLPPKLTSPLRSTDLPVPQKTTKFPRNTPSIQQLRRRASSPIKSPPPHTPDRRGPVFLQRDSTDSHLTPPKIDSNPRRCVVGKSKPNQRIRVLRFRISAHTNIFPKLSIEIVSPTF